MNNAIHISFGNIIKSLFFIFLFTSNVYAGTANLSWVAPTTNSDGSTIYDLSGFKIYYGTAPGTYSTTIVIGGAGQTTYTATNLTNGLTYYFAVTAYDTSGNESVFSTEAALLIGTADSTPPQISAVNAGSITASSGLISWATNEAADSQVEYGTTTSYGNTTTLATTLQTAHSQTVSGLASTTLYHYRVISSDAAGNQAVSGDYTFTTSMTPDTTPPQISGVYSSGVTTSGATINWTTNEASDTQVEYGMTTSYGYTTTLNTALSTGHSQSFYGLAPATLYHYRVVSSDAAGNQAVSGDYSFTTASVADTTAPVISNVQVTNITTSTATITWTTNEGSTTQIEYGTTSSYGSLTAIATGKVTTHSVTVSGLSGFTVYSFRVRSADAAGNEAISVNYTFTTSNTSPTITSFSGNPLSGYSPLPVNFSASVTDTDGYIVKHEWDFDGDGTYDQDTGLSPTASYTYTAAGSYSAKVKVTDDGGASVVSSAVTVTVNSAANQPPVVSSTTASPNSGIAPFSTTFAINGSDPDGSIVLYELDFDGNGTYDAAASTSPLSHTYTTKGSFAAKVRVTDDQGATATGSVTVTVTEAAAGTGSQNSTTPEAGPTGGCFIATAAFGSYLDPHVQALRNFRDDYLLTNRIGTAFVELYYTISPPMADFLARHESLKIAVRLALTPIVFVVSYLTKGLAFFILMVIITISGYVLIEWRRNAAR